MEKKDEKNLNGDHGDHPYCKKGIEPTTNKYKAAVESAAAILAKGEATASLEEKNQLKDIWNKIFRGSALTTC